MSLAISNVNDPPALDLDTDNSTAAGSDYMATFVEGGSAVNIVDSDTSLMDAEGNDVTLEIVAANIADGVDEILNFGASKIVMNADVILNDVSVVGVTVDVEYVDATKTFTITNSAGGALTLTEATDVLEAITYQNDSASPSIATARTFTITADDGDVSNNAVSTISISIGPGIPIVNSLTDNDSTPTITGTFDDMNTVTLTVEINGASYTVGDGNLSVAGNTWTLTIPPGDALGDGTYDVRVTATDSGANISTDGTTNELVIDTTPPATSTVVSISADSGTAGDFITNDNTLIITGTAEPSLTVEVFINGVSVGTTTTDGSGAWTFDHTGTILADGTYSVTTRATDAVGNTGPLSVATQVIVNTSSQATFTDNLTGTGIEDGADISGSIDVTDVVDGMTNPNFTISGPALGGTATIDTNTGNWIYSPNTNFNGNDRFTVSVIDDEGNVESQIINIVVSQVNDLAEFSGDVDGESDQGSVPVTGTLVASDTIDGMTNPDFTITSNPQNGVAIINATTGSWRYIPTADSSGIDSFIVSVTDDDGNVETQIINVVINTSSDISEGSSENIIKADETNNIVDETNIIRPELRDADTDVSVENAVIDAVNEASNLSIIGDVDSQGAVLDAVERTVESRSNLLSSIDDIGIDDSKVKGTSATFNVTEFSRFSEGQETNLDPLQFEQTEVDDVDKLVLRTVLRDDAVYLEIDYQIFSNTNVEVVNYRVTMVDGSALPEWLRIDDSGALVTGYPPVGLEELQLRIEVALTDGSTIIRYIEVDLTSGEIAAINEISSENIAGSSFSDQLQGSDDSVTNFYSSNPE